jgi:hypothetical protein
MSPGQSPLQQRCGCSKYKHKEIAEYVGRLNSATESLSIVQMKSPAGWSEPGQIPEFDEYTMLLRGAVRAETRA